MVFKHSISKGVFVQDIRRRHLSTAHRKHFRWSENLHIYVSSCILSSIQDKDVPINKRLNMLIIYSLILRVIHKNGIYLFWDRTFLDAYILVCSEKKIYGLRKGQNIPKKCYYETNFNDQRNVKKISRVPPDDYLRQSVHLDFTLYV